MEPMKPEVMIRQVNDLPNMTRQQTHRFNEAVCEAFSPKELHSIFRLFIVGDGDSYHAAEAVELAFENIAGVTCEPMSAQRFLDYAVEFIPIYSPISTLVVVVSASGRTERGLQCLERAKESGALTLALTGTPDSPFTQTGERVILVDVPDFGRSPGIRTYNASLMGLLLLAIRQGEAKGRFSKDESEGMIAEIASLAGVMEATLADSEGPARQAAEDYQDADKMIYLGSGPSYGTALFSAAKVVEAAGVFATGQDLEEWAHVERFSYPRNLTNMPTIIIAPPGRSRWRAVKIAELAKQLGRRVAVVAQGKDAEITRHADFTFPISGEVREEFSPLVYHISANFFAAYLTKNLGRMLFRSDQWTPA
jgi:glucosamine--fructose-6-phosphate aminotransferase (isomerizing)